MPQRCPTACGAEVSYVNARSVEPVIDATNVAIAPAIDAATATEHYGEIAWDVPTRINVEQAVISNVALADQTEGAEKLMVAGASTSAANKSQRPPRGGNEELLK